ncbi:MAG: PadR family transcriptional regulator [Longimicrobiales bacterium]
MGDTQASSTLLRGTVDLMVLRALQSGEMHGFAIARWIRDGSGDVVQFEDAALYQSLHRLQRQGLVSSRWGRSENNRRARFYTLTEGGRTRLADGAEEFHSFARAVTRLLRSDA